MRARLHVLEVFHELLGQMHADLRADTPQHALPPSRPRQLRASRMRCARLRGSMVSLSPVYGLSMLCISCAASA